MRQQCCSAQRRPSTPARARFMVGARNRPSVVLRHECPRHLLQTIENTRELVEDTPRTADEVAAAEAEDEFADHFARARAPKVLVTTCYRPTAAMYRFLTELLQARALSRTQRVRALPRLDR